MSDQAGRHTKVAFSQFCHELAIKCQSVCHKERSQTIRLIYLQIEFRDLITAELKLLIRLKNQIGPHPELILFSIRENCKSHH